MTMQKTQKIGQGDRKGFESGNGIVPRAAWPINEGAYLIGLGRSSIYKLAAEGKIRLIKIAGRRLIPDEEVVRLTRIAPETTPDRSTQNAQAFQAACVATAKGQGMSAQAQADD